MSDGKMAPIEFLGWCYAYSFGALRPPGP